MSALGPPRVGLPTDGPSTRCSYAPGPDSPGCTALATVHLRVTWFETDEVSLAACADHVEIARRAGTVLGEHPFAPGYRSHPDAGWLDNGVECGVPVDDAGGDAS